MSRIRQGFDQGAVCGWKKWSLDELVRPYDYYYDPANGRVYLVSEQSPPLRHSSIELALARHVVNQGGKQHLVFDSLAIMYGAAHGFGGGNTRHIVIRNCDLAYIGGAHQFTRPDGRPVRYGNAIEFWNAAHDHLVENCRIWEVYDAALTNQGRGPDSRQINITYRNNLIWNAEYSFEYWNRPEAAVTRNIRFVHNTCIGAGRGWAHEQRPDPNGSHLMFYSNTAETSGIQIRDNIFYDHTDWGSRYTGGWDVLPELDHNVWYSKHGVMVYWFHDKLASFDQYRETTGLEAHSVFTDPAFVDPGNGDYRVASDSPRRALVQFRLSDIQQDSPAESFSLILCRNLVFTYFDDPLQQQVLAALSERLLPGGYLVIGKHESLPANATRLVPDPARLGLFRLG